MLPVAFIVPCLPDAERGTVSAFWNIWGAPLPSAVPAAVFEAFIPDTLPSGQLRRLSFMVSFALEIVTIEDERFVVTTDVGLWQAVADYALAGGSFSPSDCEQGLYL